jgi:hypothetical protein
MDLDRLIGRTTDYSMGLLIVTRQLLPTVRPIEAIPMVKTLAQPLS